MAASAAMQGGILASPVTGLGSGGRVSKIFPVTNLPRRVHRYGSMIVRSMADEEAKDEAADPITTSPPPKPKPTPSSKVSTNFIDVFAFSGPAPERINGRLAMIGFTAAMAVELAKGQDVLAQISDGGIPWFLGTSVVLSLASLIPLFKGVSAESKSGGFMTSDAELWNGRFAMLGLVALAFTEYVKGGALV